MWESLTNFAFVSNHLTMIGIYIILALSLNLINGSLGAFSLGHNGFWGLGAYAAGVVVWTLGSSDGSAAVFVLSFAAAALTAAAFGFLVGLPALRLRGDYLAIATLACAEIFVVCTRNSEGWRALGSPAWDARSEIWRVFHMRGLGGAAGFSLGDTFGGGNDFALRLTGSQTGRNLFYLVLSLFLAALTFLFIRNLLRSVHGRAILAIREDEVAAELLGVNLTRYKVLTFVLGAALAGVAGALFANFRGVVVPAQFYMMEGIKILLMVVLGGLGSQSGTVLAVVVLYVSEQALTGLSYAVPFPEYAQGRFLMGEKPLCDLWQVIFSALLVLLILLRPGGLLGRKEFSRRYFRELWRHWRADPLPPLVSLVQWGGAILLLFLAQEAHGLLGLLLALLVGGECFQVWWRRRKVVEDET